MCKVQDVADFFAWELGPVIPDVYHRFKVAGRNKIQDVDNENYDENFSDEEAQLLIDVLRAYSKYSTSGLVDMTHRSGTPWSKVYEAHVNNVIPKKDIQAYFESLPVFGH